MSKQKPISFKTAAIIVVGLHVAGLVGMIALSSYKANLAKEARELKRAELQNFVSNRNDWPTADKKPKVAAVSVTKSTPTRPASPAASLIQLVPKQKPKPIITTDLLQEEAKKFITNQINNIKALPAGLPKPRKKVIYSKTIEDDSLPETTSITTRDIYNAMPRTLSGSSRTRNIVEEQTRVVRSYIVVQ